VALEGDLKLSGFKARHRSLERATGAKISMSFDALKLKRLLGPWVISLALMAPAVWPYFTHYFVKRDSLIATGFIHPDMPSYMANAREHFDAGHFRLTYSNPASFSYDTPAIYFQPLVFILASLWKVTAWSPGVVFMFVGFFTALCCIRAALALYRQVVGLGSWPRNLGLIAFCWGGGLLVLSGIAYKLLTHQAESRIFRFDPADGWWFLNFGRNLIFPTEAFYHALFLTCILSVIRHWNKTALALAFFVSLSHPFTGIELLSILCAWAIVENYFMEQKQIPGYFLVGCFGLMVLHIGYYLVFLNSFAEHRSIFSEWSLPWLLRAENFIPAYALVGALAMIRLRRSRLASEVLHSPQNRLFLIWFLVAFALEHHEFAIRPIQPLHFTRGYCWIALFLLGAPLLVQWFEDLLSRRRLVGVVCCVAILALFLSDNLLWFGSFIKRDDQGVRLTADQQQLLGWLNTGDNRGYVVLSQDPQIGYMTIVYTPLRSWLSHWETPERLQRKQELESFFQEGRVVNKWKVLPLLVIFSEGPPMDANSAASFQKEAPVFENRSFRVLRFPQGMPVLQPNSP
jgi:hypothetical protein